MRIIAKPLLLSVLAVASTVLVSQTGSRQATVPTTHFDSLKGKVLLPCGKPAPGAHVMLVEIQLITPVIKAETETNEQGEFTFNVALDLDPGKPAPKIVVEKQGNGISFRDLWTWKNGQEIIMDQATELRVTFLQPDGKPAAGLRVWPAVVVLREVRPGRFLLFPSQLSDRFAATTAADGTVSIKDLPQGFGFRLEHDSLHFAKLDTPFTVTLARDPVTQIDPIRLRLGASISGKVFVQETGEPIAGIKVCAQGSFDANGNGTNGWGEALSDAHGQFTINQLIEGKYNVNAWLDDPKAEHWTSVAYDSTSVKAGEQKGGLDIKLIKGGVIVGSVKYTDGSPVAQMHVGVYGPARPRSGAWVQSAVTDKEGKYRLRVPPGANYVYLSGGPATGDPPLNSGRDVTVEAGKEVNVDFVVPR